MPDQTEILLQEIAVLRQEIAHLHTVLETSNDSMHKLSLALLKGLEAQSEMVRDNQGRLPPLTQ
jgi:hypothetical protein